MTARRELLLSVALCLLGSAVVLLAVSRAWVSFRVGAAPLPSRSFTVTGHRLVPGARALALVGLAGIAAILATRERLRVVVGALVAVAGLGTGAMVLRAVADPDAAMRRAGPSADFRVSGGTQLGGWPYAALAGALLIAVAGVLVVVRSRSWASMSARYDAPADGGPREGSLWEALDRGEDPTGEAVDTGG